MMTHIIQSPPPARAAERGSALVYILIAIALLAALTVSFMQPSGTQSQNQNTFTTVSELQTQIDFIRSAVHECVLTYPGGDRNPDGSTDIDTATAGDDQGANTLYPINPGSSYFTGSIIPPTTGTRFVRDLRCPGNNPGAPDNRDHARIFGGATGKFLAPPPSLFDPWQWYNGDDGIFFWIETENTDAFIDAAFDKLEEGFATCEADQIDASGGAKDLDGAGTVTCPAGHKCFRVWMVMDTVVGVEGPESGLQDPATSTYPDETGCNT